MVHDNAGDFFPIALRYPQELALGNHHGPGFHLHILLKIRPFFLGKAALAVAIDAEIEGTGAGSLRDRASELVDRGVVDIGANFHARIAYPVDDGAPEGCGFGQDFSIPLAAQGGGG